MNDNGMDNDSSEWTLVPLSNRAGERQLENADANAILDKLKELRQLRNDAALSRLLRIKPPTISKIRSGKHGISAAILIRMHEVFDVPIKELRGWMGDHRAFF
jgi:hypothetical protein